MVKITIKHIKPGHTRDFNGLMYSSDVRAEWVRDNQDKYSLVAQITFLYCIREKALNKAYEATNSINDYWVDSIKYLFADVAGQDRVKVYPHDPEVGGHRSTSVGDIMTVQVGDAKAYDYFVDSYGFTPLAEDTVSEGA